MYSQPDSSREEEKFAVQPRMFVRPVVLCVSLLLAACGSSAVQPAASSPAAAKPVASASAKPAASAAAKPAVPAASGTTKMTIATVGGSPSIANIWVGMDQGIFARYGLTLELIDLTAPAGIAALFSNQVQMLIDAGAPIQGDVSGTKLAFLGATQSNYNQFVLMAKNNIGSIPDLKGKTVASSTPGAASDNVLVIMLKQGGLADPKTDMKWIYSQTSPAQAAALTSGQVDLAALTWPYYIGAKQSGFKVLGDSKDLKLPGASSTLAVSRSWVKDNPKLVDSFLKALIEATALTNSDRDKAVAAIANHLRKGDSLQDKTELEDGYERYRNTFPNPPYVTKEQVEEGMANTPNEEVKQHKAEDYIDNGPLDAIVQSGFTKQFVKTN
jgi:NitT/TauT family transport system substrate-binding protein